MEASNPTTDRVEAFSDGVFAVAATMLAMSIAFFSLYVWAAHRRLFAGWIDERHASYLLRRNGSGLLVYALAVGPAFVSAAVSLALCGAVAVFYLLPGRRPALA